VPLAAWCWVALPTLGVRRGLILDVTWLSATIAGGAIVFWVASALVRSPERAMLRRLIPLRRRA
jgi:hypothetical protein